MTEIPKSGDFSKLLGRGENPNGMVVQTANGTIVNGRGGDGDCRPWTMADGPLWNTDPRPDGDRDAMMSPPMGLVQAMPARRRR